MFDLQHLTYEIDNKPIISNINAQFECGQVVGLIGHNGSGKSTLIKILAKQLTATSGDILLNNRSISQWKNKAFAKEVAYLPQYLPMSTGLTVKELVSFGRFAWHGLLEKNNQTDEKIIQASLKLTQTQQFSQRFIDELSGGERHRVFLAMCLAQKSHYLLLDEPLAALDISHQLEVIKLIQKLAHELNLGIIIVIHDINLAAQYCDRLLALKNGQLIYDEIPSQLMTSEKLKKIYGVNLSMIKHPFNHKKVALL